MMDSFLDYAYAFLWIAVVMVCMFFATKLLLHFVRKLGDKSNNASADIIVSSFTSPLVFLIGVLSLRFALDSVRVDLDLNIGGVELGFLIGQLSAISFPVALGWFVLKLVAKAKVVILAKYDSGANWVLFVKVIQVFVAASIILIIVEKLGFSIRSVLAFGGIGGVAVGFAAKDTIANFFGSLVLSIDRPFSIGDSIYSPDRQIEGTVQEIGWRFTKVLTPEKILMFVPNALFTSVVIQNRTRISLRRVRFTVRIMYPRGVDPREMTRKIQERLLQEDHIIPQQSSAIISLLGSRMVDIDVILLSTQVAYINTLRLKEGAVVIIEEFVTQMNCEVVFPAATVELELYPKFNKPC